MIDIDISDLVVNVSEKWQDLSLPKYKVGDVVVLEIVDVGNNNFYPSLNSAIKAKEAGVDLTIKDSEIRQVKIETAISKIVDDKAIWAYYSFIGDESEQKKLKFYTKEDILAKL
jgi:hypothetical protein